MKLSLNVHLRTQKSTGPIVPACLIANYFPYDSLSLNYHCIENLWNASFVGYSEICIVRYIYADCIQWVLFLLRKKSIQIRVWCSYTSVADVFWHTVTFQMTWTFDSILFQFHALQERGDHCMAFIQMDSWVCDRKTTVPKCLIYSS
jgi:hypothetical protein